VNSGFIGDCPDFNWAPTADISDEGIAKRGFRNPHNSRNPCAYVDLITALYLMSIGRGDLVPRGLARKLRALGEGSVPANGGPRRDGNASNDVANADGGDVQPMDIDPEEGTGGSDGWLNWLLN
jgi:hypothetical protein